MAENHSYQSGRGDVTNKPPSLTEEQWDTYLKRFEGALEQCNDIDNGPMERMLMNLGSHSNMFITHKRDAGATTPLTLAVSLGNIGAFDFLLRHGASNVIREDVMESIVQTLNPRYIDVLCKNGVDLNMFANSILKCIMIAHDPHSNGVGESTSDATHERQLKMLEKLLQAKVDTNLTSQSSTDPWGIITYVIKNKCLTEEQKIVILELLFKHNMDVNRTYVTGSNKSDTLLQTAMREKLFIIAKYLLDHGANANALSSFRRSAIHEAYWRATNLEGDAKAVEDARKAILWSGADWSTYKQYGDTVDIFATFRCFMRHGIDVTLQDTDGIALIDRFMFYNKTYVEFNSREVHRRGYEREIKCVIQNCEVALLQNQEIHQEEIFYYFIFSLPVLCYLVQAGYMFEVVCKALLLKVFETDAIEVLKLMSFAEPYMYRLIDPCPLNLSDFQEHKVAKRLDDIRVKSIYKEFRENQVGVPSLMQCSVYVLRRHCSSVVNGESDLKTSKSIHSRLLQLSTDFLPASLASVLTLERFVVDSDLPCRDGNGCVIEESAAYRYFTDIAIPIPKHSVPRERTIPSCPLKPRADNCI